MIIKDNHVKPSIGFIGMGHMGSHMAMRLLAEGYPLTVYDRTREKTLPVAQRGANVIKTPRVVAENSNVIISSVTDDAAISGSVPQAETGSLIIFVGGEKKTYQACKPILDVLSRESFYMGPSGMGTTMKLVANTLRSQYADAG